MLTLIQPPTQPDPQPITPATSPPVSVVMPVYNGAAYLREAIDSILNQTFRNFELLVIDDGSTDNSLEIIESYTDPRIRLLRNPGNWGVAFTRNVGLREARGNYLAWCDCDDVSLPTRLEKQVAWLDAHPHIGACGTGIVRFGGGQKEVVSRVATDSDYLRGMLLFMPALPNATVMLRKDLVYGEGLAYSEKLAVGEDFDFVLRCSWQFSVANLSEVLYRYRASESSIMKSYAETDERMYGMLKQVYKRVLTRLGIESSEENLRTHYLINSENLLNGKPDLTRCLTWLLRLQAANKQVDLVAPAAFRQVLAERFYFAAKKASRGGPAVFLYYLFQAARHFKLARPLELLKLAARCGIRYNKF
ncbi:MAG: glycosyltransferase family 2 protein [Saprospiraceae bacterium]